MWKRQLKALIIKEMIIHKMALLTPIITIVIMYLIQIISFLIALANNGIVADEILQKLNFDYQNTSSSIGNFNFISNYYISKFTLVLSSFTLIYLTQKTMNEERNQKCELFYRSQPISDGLIIGAKVLVMIGGTWIVALIIGLLNFVIVNSIFSYVIMQDFNWLDSLLGFSFSMIKGFFLFFMGNLMIFCSAIFKKGAFVKFLSILIGFSVFRKIVNTLYDWSIPSISKFLTNQIFSDFSESSKAMFANRPFVDYLRADFFYYSIMNVMFGIVFLSISYYVYHRREIS